MKKERRIYRPSFLPFGTGSSRDLFSAITIATWVSISKSSVYFHLQRSIVSLGDDKKRSKRGVLKIGRCSFQISSQQGSTSSIDNF